MISIFIFLICCIAYLNAQLSCDFEKDLCGYTANENFIRYSGKSPSKSSGPEHDRAFKDGFYALCNGMRLLNSSDICRLSKHVKLKKSIKYSFWYFMNGHQIGTLTLTANNDIIWQLSGRQSDEWLYTEVALPSGNYLLEFIGNRSISGRYSSDIAIDDIVSGGEPPTTITTSTSITTSAPSLSSNILIKYLSSCTFDEDLCGWYNEYEDFSWANVQTIDENELKISGPQSDYTSISQPLYINGNIQNITCAIPYCFESNEELYYCTKITDFIKINGAFCGAHLCPSQSTLETTGQCELGRFVTTTSNKYSTKSSSFKSRFYSPVFERSSLQSSDDILNNICIMFQYNIWSDDKSNIDGLRLYLQNFNNKSEIYLLWSSNGLLLINKWYNVSHTIFLFNFKLFQFIFEPYKITKSNSIGSISIDHIQFYNDHCDNVKVTTTLRKTTTATSTTTTTIDTSETSTNGTININPDEKVLRKQITIIILAAIGFIIFVVIPIVIMLLIFKFKFKRSSIHAVHKLKEEPVVSFLNENNNDTIENRKSNENKEENINLGFDEFELDVNTKQT